MEYMLKNWLEEVYIMEDIFQNVYLYIYICYRAKYTQSGNGRIPCQFWAGFAWPWEISTPGRVQQLRILEIKDVSHKEFGIALDTNKAPNVRNLHFQVGHLTEKLDLDTCLTPEAEDGKGSDHSL